MTSDFHYEEMKAFFNMWADAGLGVDLWGYYRFEMIWTVDVLQLSPYRQTFWFSRFLSD
jgi:hypothetical protein